jgi:hypothetical protein
VYYKIGGGRLAPNVLRRFFGAWFFGTKIFGGGLVNGAGSEANILVSASSPCFLTRFYSFSTSYSLIGRSPFRGILGAKSPIKLIVLSNNLTSLMRLFICKSRFTVITKHDAEEEKHELWNP